MPLYRSCPCIIVLFRLDGFIISGVDSFSLAIFFWNLLSSHSCQWYVCFYIVISSYTYSCTNHHDTFNNKSSLAVSKHIVLCNDFVLLH